ncbi:hypothetical protein HMPREF1575_00789 [Gardnerella vaginalis JCP7672]|nr:hypothetical protein HMPREF1575_00789 [Gardnerella vaginalis JCP7672]
MPLYAFVAKTFLENTVYKPRDILKRLVFSSTFKKNGHKCLRTPHNLAKNNKQLIALTDAWMTCVLRFVQDLTLYELQDHTGRLLSAPNVIHLQQCMRIG